MQCILCSQGKLELVRLCVENVNGSWCSAHFILSLQQKEIKENSLIALKGTEYWEGGREHGSLKKKKRTRLHKNGICWH